MNKARFSVMSRPAKSSLTLYAGFVLVILGLMIARPVHAGSPCVTESGPTPTPLLELYTSEGCSSCPPADAWFGDLPRAGVKADRLVRLALHVDYWDYIGWRDPYGQARHTKRQREIARRANSRTIYTPQFVLNGQDWRGRGVSDLLSGGARDNTPPTELNLMVDSAPGTLTGYVQAFSETFPASWRMQLVLYEDGLVSSIKAGENDGRTLKHDHVARSWSPAFTANNKVTEHAFVIDPTWKRNNLGIVAFIEDSATGQMIQAVDRPVCR